MSNNNTTTRKMREPLTLEQVDAAFQNPSNLFLSIHASDPGEQNEMSKYKFLTRDGRWDKDITQSSFEATVPEDLIVITFTPRGCLAVTDKSLEKKLRQRLSNPDWMKRGRGSGRKDGDVEHIVDSAQIYYPGQKLLNLLMSFDKEKYYDLFTIDAGGGKLHEPVQSAGETISSLKKSTLEKRYKGKEGKTTYNLRTKTAIMGKKLKAKEKNRVWGKSKEYIFGDYTVQEMLDKISRPKTTRAWTMLGYAKHRILYILACSPTLERDAYRDEIHNRMVKIKKVDYSRSHNNNESMRAFHTKAESAADGLLATITGLANRMQTIGMQRFKDLKEIHGGRTSARPGAAQQRAQYASSTALMNLPHATEKFDKEEAEQFKENEERLKKYHGKYTTSDGWIGGCRDICEYNSEERGTFCLGGVNEAAAMQGRLRLMPCTPGPGASWLKWFGYGGRTKKRRVKRRRKTRRRRHRRRRKKPRRRRRTRRRTRRAHRHKKR